MYLANCLRSMVRNYQAKGYRVKHAENCSALISTITGTPLLFNYCLVPSSFLKCWGSDFYNSTICQESKDIEVRPQSLPLPAFQKISHGPCLTPAIACMSRLALGYYFGRARR